MEKYPSNSNVSKENKPTAPVKQLDPPSRAVQNKTGVSDIISDNVSGLKDYVVDKVIKPAAMRMLEDTATNLLDVVRNIGEDCISIMFYGEVGHTRKKKKSKSGISYEDYWDRQTASRDRERDRYRTEERQRSRRASGSSFYIEDVIIREGRDYAEDILIKLEDIISRDGYATIAQYYDLCGLEVKHTDWNYGWEDLRDAYVDRKRDYCVIRMPKVTVI